jgi:hypothetical protein
MKKNDHLKGKEKKHKDQFLIHQMLNDEIKINKFKNKKTKVNSC